MPWDRPANPILLTWLAKSDVAGEGRTAVVVGCGLGGDAEELAERGFRTTAFDVAPTAAAVARERHPDSTVDYRVADLFALPAEWRHAFDLVVEAVTVQALPPVRQKAAAGAVAELVARGGTLLVITVVRDGVTALKDGPPWPLRREDLHIFAVRPRTRRDRRRSVRERDRQSCRAALPVITAGPDDVRYGVFLTPDARTSAAVTTISGFIRAQFGLVSAGAFPPHVTLASHELHGQPDLRTEVEAFIRTSTCPARAGSRPPP
jgi:SAM-dependent methyltransferase